MKKKKENKPFYTKVNKVQRKKDAMLGLGVRILLTGIKEEHINIKAIN